MQQRGGTMRSETVWDNAKRRMTAMRYLSQ